MDKTAAGLEGVIAAETRMSLVDGARGRLIFRGVPLLEATREGFERTASLLLDAPLPDLGALRQAAFERQEGLSGLPSEPMAHLRAAVASSSASGLALACEVGVAMTRAAASLQGRTPVPPNPRLDHGRDLLRMASPSEVSPAQGAAFSRYLATVMEHGLNASTFAARVVCSTRADDCSAVVAAIGALKGPLHGGAPGPVLDMLDAVADCGDPAGWIAAELAAGRRIMGMGHRVYRVRDPRAAALEAAMEGLSSPRLALARRVEAEAQRQLALRHPGRELRANVEFYTALLLEAVGLDRALFTPAFACGRVIGWLGHIREQRAVDRILRPRARYVGPQPA